MICDYCRPNVPCADCHDEQMGKAQVYVVYYIEKQTRFGKEMRWLGDMKGRLGDVLAHLQGIFGRADAVMHVRESSRVRVGSPVA